MGADGQQPPFQVMFSSGDRLLDARAMWASLVGPHRLAMAQAKSVELRQDAPELIYKNLGAADAYAFVGVSLPSGAPAVSIGTLFSREDQLGVNTSIPVNLAPTMLGGPFFSIGFTQILMPDEQIYAQLNDAALAPGATQRVVVATVLF